MVSKPKTQTNQRVGKILQKIRVEHGILEQLLLAEKVGWKESKVRDREIAVASCTLVDLLRFSYVFDMNPVDMACRMISPICIDLNKTATDNPERLEVWIKDERTGVRKFAKALMETKFPGSWNRMDDYVDALYYLTDTIDEIRRDITEEINKGKREPYPMKDATHLDDEWALKMMKIQGRNLKAARLRKGYASQWSGASKILVNPSWCQCRESAKVVIKIEDVVSISEAWDYSPYKLIEMLFDENPPTDEDLRNIRKKYC